MKDYKRITFSNMNNCRDLGGYECDLGMFKYHVLYRSDAPTNLSDDEWKKIYNDMGVRTIIDLRSQYEQKYMNYVPADGINYISYPLQDETRMPDELGDVKQAALNAFGDSLNFAYSGIVHDKPERLAGVINSIAQGLRSGAVLFHCTAGKDRTGIIAVFIYMICGVASDDIVADYQVTEAYSEALNSTVDIPDSMRFILESPASVMREFTKSAYEENYISILKEHGLKDECVEIIREICMER